MEFSFVNMITDHVAEQFAFINRISDYLFVVFGDRDFGQGVRKAVFGLACGGPLSDAWLNEPTGLVSQLKHTKSQRLIELTVSLGFDEVRTASHEELIEVVKRGVLSTRSEVTALNIKDFDVDRFYEDLEAILNDREWLKHPEKYKRPPFVFQLNQREDEIPEDMKMDQDTFWSLIQESLVDSQGSVEKQISSLIARLSMKGEENIIGFELTLRELIRRSYDYNVVGLLRVIEGSVTDDTLLYFRCRLILYGQDVFHTVLENPNDLTHQLDNDYQAELLLSVANEAFIQKCGGKTDKDLPADVGEEYVDYNTDDYQITGIPWREKDFAKRFARLLELYGHDNQ